MAIVFRAFLLHQVLLLLGVLAVFFALLFPRLGRFEMFTPVTVTIFTIVPVVFIPY
jgi:uncharacterized membrane protein YhhN